MKRILSAFLLAAVLPGLLLVSGCTSTTRIVDIKNNASYWAGREVTVKGQVDNSFWLALLAKGAYQIDDGTAGIWVVCSQPPPANSAQVTVSGEVENAISVGDRALGTVIVEIKRK